MRLPLKFDLQPNFSEKWALFIEALVKEDRSWVTRWAPSPTGHLHLGHAFHLKCLETLAQSLSKFEVIFRFEDHDRQRAKAEFYQSILADTTAWVPQLSLSFKPSHQERKERYIKWLDEHSSLLFKCYCSKATSSKRAANGEWLCSGECSESPSKEEISDLLTPENYKRDYNLRIRLQAPTKKAQDRLKNFDESSFSGFSWNDAIIADRLGNLSYLICNSLDDYDQGVNLIFRGEDLWEQTPKQLALYDIIGFKDYPKFAHHPLITFENRKLAKRSQDQSLNSYLDEYSKEDLFKALGLSKIINF